MHAWRHTTWSLIRIFTVNLQGKQVAYMHVGHRKTMQTQTRRHIMWSLIRIITVNLQPVWIENYVKILLTWTGKSIWFEWVNAFTLHHMTINVVLTLWMRNSYSLFLSIMLDLCVCVCVCVCVFFFCYIMSHFLIIPAVFSFLHYIASRGTSYFHCLIYHWYHFWYDSIKAGTRIVQAYTLSYWLHYMTFNVHITFLQGRCCSPCFLTQRENLSMYRNTNTRILPHLASSILLKVKLLNNKWLIYNCIECG